MFLDGDELLPWYVKPFLKKGFGHVLAFSQHGPDVMVVDPTYRWMETQIRYSPAGREWVCPAEFIAADFALHGGRVVKIRWEADSTMTSHHFSNYFPGCVTIMKCLLGVAVWVFTPYQFYQWLMDNGGIEYDEQRVREIVVQVKEDRKHGRW